MGPGLGACLSALQGEARTHWVRSSWEEEKTQIIFVFSSEQNIHGLCGLQGARRGLLCLLGVCDHTLRTEPGCNGLPSVPQPVPGLLTLSRPPQWSAIAHLGATWKATCCFSMVVKEPHILGAGQAGGFGECCWFNPAPEAIGGEPETESGKARAFPTSHLQVHWF